MFAAHLFDCHNCRGELQRTIDLFFAVLACSQLYRSPRPTNFFEQWLPSLARGGSRPARFAGVKLNVSDEFPAAPSKPTRRSTAQKAADLFYSFPLTALVDATKLPDSLSPVLAYLPSLGLFIQIVQRQLANSRSYAADHRAPSHVDERQTHRPVLDDRQVGQVIS